MFQEEPRFRAEIPEEIRTRANDTSPVGQEHSTESRDSLRQVGALFTGAGLVIAAVVLGAAAGLVIAGAVLVLLFRDTHPHNV